MLGLPSVVRTNNGLRLIYIACLAVVTPLGFATKFYSGPGAWELSSSAGGLLYVLFWMLIVCVVAPTLSSRSAATGVFLVTCALEILQLWHPALLQRIRSTFVGQAILGDTFDWSDFPYYAAGALTGYLLVKRVQSKNPGTPTEAITTQTRPL